MTLAVDDARGLGHSTAIPLIIFNLRCGVALAVSDRAITFDSVSYDALLMNVPEVSESVSIRDSTAINSDCSIVLSNEALSMVGAEYSSLISAHDVYPLDGARVRIWHIFTDAGQNTTSIKYFEGAVDEPSEITEKSVTLRCSSMPHYRARLAARSLTADVLFNGTTGIVSDDAAYGTVGSRIERPDYVIKKYLTQVLGFTLDEIDATSFDLAGTWYAANNYELAVLVSQETAYLLPPLYRMAFNARSLLWYAAGMWYLAVLPDTPSPIVRTLARGDLEAGSKYQCGFTRADEIETVLTVRYNLNTGTGVWGATVTLGEPGPLEERIIGAVDLEYVVAAAQARSVGELALQMRERLFKTISFPVLWDATDLQIGDAVTITGMGFWEGVKFWVGGVSRGGADRATYSAVEWW